MPTGLPDAGYSDVSCAYVPTEGKGRGGVIER
jgi:hypothetical protein